MEPAGLQRDLLILALNCFAIIDATSFQPLHLTVDLNIFFDVAKLKQHSVSEINELVNLLKNETISYFDHPSLNAKLNINVRDASVMEMPKRRANEINGKYLNQYCNHEQAYKSQPVLSVLFVDRQKTINEERKREQKVYSNKGSYCDTSKDCGLIEFRSWAENAFNLARVIASSVGVGFDGLAESRCSDPHVVMQMWYNTKKLLPTEWSVCSRVDLTEFLKSDSSKCISHQNVLLSDKITNSGNDKLRIDVEIFFDLPNDKMLTLKNNLHKMKRCVERYFSQGPLHLQLEANIKIGNPIDVTGNNTDHGPDFLKYVCSLIKHNKGPKYFSVVITERDLYGMDKTEIKDYDKVFFAKEGNYCNQSNNCAVIEHDRLKDDVYNLVRAIGSSLGMTIDGLGNNCKQNDTIMGETYNRQNIPNKWSQCSKNDFNAFMKSKQSECLKPKPKPKIPPKKPVDKKLQIYVQIHFESPSENENLYIFKKDIQNKFKHGIEEYFAQDVLRALVDVHVRLGNPLTETTNHTYGPDFLKHVCSLVTHNNGPKYFSVVITERDLYGMDKTGIKNYDKVFFSEEGNYCNQTNNCAVIERGLLKDDVFNIVRVLASSLGMTVDGSNNSCKQNDTIMGETYDGQNIPKKWSQCSKHDFSAFMRSRKSYCLRGQTKPGTGNREKKPPHTPGKVTVDVEFHFVIKEIDQHVAPKKIKPTVEEIANITQHILKRPKLNLDLELNIVDIKEVHDKSVSFDQSYLDTYCKQQDGTKYTVVIIKSDLLHTRRWINEVFANPNSMCLEMKNCAVISWDDNVTTASRLSGALAFSLGASMDSDHNNCPDSLILLGSPRIRPISGWSQCTREGIRSYLKSEESNCLRENKIKTNPKPKNNVTETSKRPNPVPNPTTIAPVTDNTKPSKKPDDSENTPRTNCNKTSENPAKMNYEINIDFHFMKEINTPVIKAHQNLMLTTDSIITEVQKLFHRHDLHHNLILNLERIKLINGNVSLSRDYLNMYCNQETKTHSNKLTYIVLLIDKLKEHLHGTKHYWDKELYAHAESMCDKMKNCAIVAWDNVPLTAARVSRALAISLGAPKDFWPISCVGDTVMTPGYTGIKATTEWSMCSAQGIQDYLRSDHSSCITKKKGQSDGCLDTTPKDHQNKTIAKDDEKNSNSDMHDYDIYISGNIKVEVKKHKRMQIN